MNKPENITTGDEDKLNAGLRSSLVAGVQAFMKHIDQSVQKAEVSRV
jgi:hypothetical protein